MPAEENGQNQTRDHSFDELAKGLANRSLSRRDALKWVGAALVGGLLSAIPGVAWAHHRPGHGEPPGQGSNPPPGQGGTPPGQGTTTTTPAPTPTTTTSPAPTTTTTTTLAPTTTTSTTTTSPPVSCAHDICQTGEALTPDCDPCVSQICAQDPFCCEVAWDFTCRSEVTSICGNTCPALPCHDPCETGGPMPSDCDPCVSQICAQDPFCCEVEWDASCVSEVTSICGNTCPAGTLTASSSARRR